MVRFRNVTDGEDVTNVWTNGSNQIAFGRGNKGFVAINGSNNKAERLKGTFQTGLPEGRYCDVIRGNRASDKKSCTGLVIEVSASGEATLDIEGQEAVAFHRSSKLREDRAEAAQGSTVNSDQVALTLEVVAGTSWGENVYVVGNIKELGEWNPDRALKMNPWRYPKWEVTALVPKGTAIEFKFFKRLADGRVIWEDNRQNRSITTTNDKTASVPNLQFDK
jgi:alpha-amylase